MEPEKVIHDIFTTFTHAIMHLVYPTKFYITIVLGFSWDDHNTQEKLETMVMQNLGVKQGALWSM